MKSSKRLHHKDEYIYLIGEIGQNHNGSVGIAKALIDMASQPIRDELFDRKLRALDAIKLTKRDLKQELSRSQMRKPYKGFNSFGETYGEHREKLELSNSQHYELFRYAKNRGLDVVETLCSTNCLSILNFFEPDKLKVASRDLSNIPLLEAMAETKIPMIISTGMATEKDLDQAMSAINKSHNNVSILHCLSQYPADYQNINLKTITYLKNKFPDNQVGYSDHSIGVFTPVAAVAIGAKIIEKHITLDRRMKGTDQKGSLDINGLHQMVKDIRNLEICLGSETPPTCSDSVKEAKLKLERSIATKRDLKKGDVIREGDLHLLSPGDGFSWLERGELIGKTLKNEIMKDEIIYPSDLNTEP